MKNKMNETSAEISRAAWKNTFHASRRREAKRNHEIETNSTMIRPILKSAPYEPKQILIKKKTDA